jgi:hypothetical protein
MEQSMEESKIQELRLIHRELAHHLRAHNEILVSVKRAVGAIQYALDNDFAPQGGHSALSEKYRERLAAAIANESLPQSPLAHMDHLSLDQLIKKLTEW